MRNPIEQKGFVEIHGRRITIVDSKTRIQFYGKKKNYKMINVKDGGWFARKNNMLTVVTDNKTRRFKIDPVARCYASL